MKFDSAVSTVLKINENKYKDSQDGSTTEEQKGNITFPNISVNYESTIPMRRFKKN